MSNKDKKPRRAKAVPLPPITPDGLGSDDAKVLEAARAEAIETLSKKHGISTVVAACILDAKLKEMHQEADLKNIGMDKVRSLLDDCYPDEY